jgi:hypothetical protein
LPLLFSKRTRALERDSWPKDSCPRHPAVASGAFYAAFFGRMPAAWINISGTRLDT